MADLKLTATYKEYGDEIWFGGDGCGMWIIESDPHNDLTAYLGGLGETKEGRDAMEARARLLAAAPELYDAVAKALLWITDPTADQLEQWERIASEFHNDTGYLRPGKDYPMGTPEPYDRDSVWQEWTYTRHRALLDKLKAALAKARGEK